jgi:propanol-preferring alcohol dehydrogenase
MAMTRGQQRGVEPIELATPVAGPRQVLVEVAACGVCRTDLHVVDGDLPNPVLPIVPGHEIVGRVVQIGQDVDEFSLRDRVGIPWLGYACGTCPFCSSGRENLCRNARYTGYQLNGGYADFAVADAAFCFRLPPSYDDAHAAPLLCAGLIGYRAYRMAVGRRIGIYGFGAAAHIIAQVARHQNREVYGFVRPGDDNGRQFALDLGVTWAGWSTEPPPSPLDSAIIFAPSGSLVPEALSRTVPGGVVVCAGIHMSQIPAFDYSLLWEERMVRSVANLTRNDAREFLTIAAQVPIQTHVHTYPLEHANQALDHLRAGRIKGAAVLTP